MDIISMIISLVLGVVAFSSPFLILLILSIIILNSPTEEVAKLPKITFQSFYDFYSLSPSTWELKGEYVEKLTTGESLKFTFNNRDYRKYQKFLNELDKKARKEEELKLQQHNNQQTIKLLEAVQEEINTMKAQSVRDIGDSAKTMMEIQDRIIGG